VLIQNLVEDYLLADAQIAVRIGTRIEPLPLTEQCIFPAMTLTMVSSVYPELLDGTTSLAFADFQVSCWAATVGAARELAALVRRRMLGISDAELVGFQKAEILDERDDDSPDLDLNAYRSDVDFRVAFAESSP
jgi:hypothetical protein